MRLNWVWLGYMVDLEEGGFGGDGGFSTWTLMKMMNNMRERISEGNVTRVIHLFLFIVSQIFYDMVNFCT